MDPNSTTKALNYVYDRGAVWRAALLAWHEGARGWWVELEEGRVFVQLKHALPTLILNEMKAVAGRQQRPTTLRASDLVIATLGGVPGEKFFGMVLEADGRSGLDFEVAGSVTEEGELRRRAAPL